MKFLFLRCIVISFFFYAAESRACSAFLLTGKDHNVVGFNENWKTMPGMIVVNKREVLKRNISWKNLTTNQTQPNKQWISKFGSVTFNLLGYDFPCYGVNEKGLFLVELYLEETTKVYNPKQPDMFWAQWIQYQLDNYKSVKEVVDHLNEGPNIDWWPNAAGSHFFLADTKGNSATIALLNGKYNVLTNKEMPMPLLCNNQYHKDLTSAKKFDFLGGNKKFDFNQSTNWEDRYNRAYYMLKNYNYDKKPVDYAWNILNSIHPGEWQTVIDTKKMNLFFKSDLKKEVKTIDINKLDFSKNASIKYLDIHIDKTGTVNDHFQNLTVLKNNEYVEKGFPIGYDNKEFGTSRIFETLKKNIVQFFGNILQGA
ncbi:MULTISPECIES: linear amide C-N hydrolase [Chryseobacterium]|uniref:linear amide C-N hydrolase n=1 Tax=Chryseobacterium TaxID=59732 RepID=UPI00195CE56E|nr:MULTISPECIES: linear amide C-N hydrolase [Chryseobacterium]MBM7420534.1 penicillin V acylase-like amidase (Ntn superfamily) [Chryseobacterium sp. JUb44]MDH6210484.1 penicillin V acylase-like amidase (Ntn superfamily) [Chryseobacterium sp. BIGb0186]WSO09178.1 linear amide C-N hydrolase [Chryseobacterium scophthalmum]